MKQRMRSWYVLVVSHTRTRIMNGRQTTSSVSMLNITVKVVGTFPLKLYLLNNDSNTLTLWRISLQK